MNLQSLTSPNDVRGFFCYFASDIRPICTYDYVCFASSEDEALNRFKRWLQDFLGKVPEGIFVARDINQLMEKA